MLKYIATFFKRYNQPLLLVILTSISVFISEVLVMNFISDFTNPATWQASLIDSLIIMILIIPVLYFSLLRPLQKLIREKSLNEQKFKDMFFKNNSIKLVIDPFNGDIVEANSAACVFYKYTYEKIKSLKIWDINCLSKEDVFVQMSLTMENKKLNHEFQHRLANGEIRDVQVFSGPITINGKSLLHSIIIDITQRKVAQRSNKRLSRAIEQIDETIVITDKNGIIEYVNPAFEKTTGYTAQEAIGQKLRILKSSEHSSKFYAEIWKTLRSGNQWTGEITNKKKDGSLFIVHVIISPVLDDKGKIINYVAAKNDITETKRLQEQEARASRLELAGTIAGQVAHDFNNLLSPIMVYPEFIHDVLPEDHQAHAYLNTIEESAKKISEINQDLLTMGRRGHYNLNVINLNTIIQQVINDIQSNIKNISIELNLEKELLNIKGGSAQIHRMLTNLLVNAKDSMKNNGTIHIKSENYYIEQTTVVFSKIPIGEYVKVTIRDNGCGMPPDVIQKIFDPFFSTKNANNKSGSGLGMSVVDSVIKDHNGFIDVESEVGKGTSFFLYFPITREESKTEFEYSIKGGTEKILIIDDDPIQREVQTHILEKLGYKVSTATDGANAINFVKDNPQDLILLDMIMPPGIDGTETYKQILKLYPSQKAILVSGYSESVRVKEALKLGVGAFLKKPFTKKNLAAIIRKEFDKKLQLTH